MKIPSSSSLFNTAKALLESGKHVILVKIETAKGSTPRDEGCVMLVLEKEIFGTIGGGQLEWIASHKARELIANGNDTFNQTIPLGPEIGQCCGGSVELSYTTMTTENVLSAFINEDDIRPQIQLHGAGHTGKALLQALSLLPFDVSIIDTRKNVLPAPIDSTKLIQTALPEQEVRRAKPGTAFVVFTHEHHLDFLIAAEALKRGDAAYVGMIGSKTKRAVFANWLTEDGYETETLEGLTSPIGGSTVKDKRPEIIGALVASELIEVFSEQS